jgi:hypothetical protein
MSNALDDLIAAVEAGEWDFRADGPARQVFPYRSASADDLGLTARAAFEGSLDAALALHNAVLPGWHWAIEDDDQAEVFQDPVKGEDGMYRPGPNALSGRCDKTNPARAWLLAILRAMKELNL